MADTLREPIEVAFDYTRSTGPVLGAYLTGLRERRVLAARLSDGTVVTPPPEFDPVTHRALAAEDLVQVAAEGELVSWTWVPEPVRDQPFDRPFAWALVRLDGTDSPFLHALDVDSVEDLARGARVRVRWAEEPTGAITDIACFEPADGFEARSARTSTTEGARATSTTEGARATSTTERARAAEEEPVTGIISPVRLDYLYAASEMESSFFRGLAEGRLIGQRCPTCGKVYIPPRGACPVDGVPTDEAVELPDTGTVTTFCVVNVPFLGQKITPPYVSAYVLLDGADIAFLHLIQGIEADRVRMGMRVRARWRPRAEWGTTIENIEHFEPTGEPDADFDTYRQHL